MDRAIEAGRGLARAGLEDICVLNPFKLVEELVSEYAVEVVS